MTPLQQDIFGTLPNGTPVERYQLRNAANITVNVITYGGIITSLHTPDRTGAPADIVLGYDTLDGYLSDSPYFGAIVGRYANRIARGRFTLDGTTYQLAINNGPNHLHGGIRGFDKVLWNATPFIRDGATGVVLRYTSVDGEEGYPGTLHARITYTLTNDNALAIEYDATTDQPTPVNLTQHTYFNLAGAQRDILGHELRIDADRYTPVDSTLIPTGELRSVANTPFDFRTPLPIGTRINVDDDQLRYAGGYDHNFVLTPRRSVDLTSADLPEDLLVTAKSTHAHQISVFEPTSGRTLDIDTTEPGVQFYSGNFLTENLIGKGGRHYAHRYGFCLETQHFPDSPNHPNFPSTILRPGERYQTRTTYRFGSRNERP